MDVGWLVREEAAGWATLLDVFHGVPAHRFEEPGVTPEGWSPKDVMFHLAGWLDDCALVLGRIGDGTFERGSEPDDGQTIDINRTWYEQSRSMDAEQVRRAFERSRDRASRAFGRLKEISPEAWEWFEESGPLHYAAHARDIEAWLAR
jgi:Mycothiol maleylpyruvate isomerase N-terminal domain